MFIKTQNDEVSQLEMLASDVFGATLHLSMVVLLIWYTEYTFVEGIKRNRYSTKTKSGFRCYFPCI